MVMLLLDHCWLVKIKQKVKGWGKISRPETNEIIAEIANYVHFIFTAYNRYKHNGQAAVLTKTTTSHPDPLECIMEISVVVILI